MKLQTMKFVQNPIEKCSNFPNWSGSSNVKRIFILENHFNRIRNGEHTEHTKYTYAHVLNQATAFIQSGNSGKMKNCQHFSGLGHLWMIRGLKL